MLQGKQAMVLNTCRTHLSWAVYYSRTTKPTPVQSFKRKKAVGVGSAGRKLRTYRQAQTAMELTF